MPQKRSIRVRCRRGATLLAALLLALAAGAAGAAEDARPRDDAEATTAQEEAPKCVHGCLRWGKFCNVDPRGVYKCQRRCEKFGEICE